jgi:hypothetical protein
MNTYLLEYRHPYEFDDGDSGGGHEVCWQSMTWKFEESSDKKAKVTAAKFLADRYIIFEGEIYRSKSESLTKVIFKEEKK